MIVVIIQFTRLAPRKAGAGNLLSGDKTGRGTREKEQGEGTKRFKVGESLILIVF